LLPKRRLLVSQQRLKLPAWLRKERLHALRRRERQHKLLLLKGRKLHALQYKGKLPVLWLRRKLLVSQQKQQKQLESLNLLVSPLRKLRLVVGLLKLKPPASKQKKPVVLKGKQLSRRRGQQKPSRRVWLRKRQRKLQLRRGSPWWAERARLHRHLRHHLRPLCSRRLLVHRRSGSPAARNLFHHLLHPSRPLRPLPLHLSQWHQSHHLHHRSRRQLLCRLRLQ
jgi:hypothetical protein